MKTFKKFFILSIQFFFVFEPVRSQESISNNTNWLPHAKVMLSQGQFMQCIQLLNLHLPLSDFDREEIEGLHLRANAHLALGQFQHAYNDLKQAKIFSKDLDSSMHIKTLTNLGDLCLSVGRLQDALNYAQKATKEAKKIKDLHLQAITLNNLANTLMASTDNIRVPNPVELPSEENHLTVAFRGMGSLTRKVIVEPDQPKGMAGDFQEAITHYEQCIQLALKVDDQPLAIRATINKARAAFGMNDYSLACQSLTQSGTMITGVGHGFERGYLQLSRGVLASRFAKEESSCARVELKLIAAEAFYDALQIGDVLGSLILQSQAQGELAKLYENDGRLEEAIQLTRAAVFAAHQDGNSRLTYTWHWHLGRLLRKLGNHQEAINQYQQAITTLHSIRNGLSVGYRKMPNIFKDHIKPVYYELTELYLEEAKRAPAFAEEQHYLILARDTLESMKSAQLQDYFQDPCVTAHKRQGAALNTMVPGAAVLYPIILPDRLVILLSLSDGIHQFAQDVDADELNAIINDYRHGLQSPYPLNQKDGKRSSQLFDWLIRPLQDHLQQFKVDTLIIIPDGSLMLIPFSTLYDGEKFLIENYAVVTAPGLILTDPKPFDKAKSRALMLGLSEAVMTHKGLPAVLEEIDQITNIIGGKVIVNSAFTPKRVDQELKRENYTIIHMATHAKFDRHPEKTFLLTHKGKISLTKLEELLKFSQFREEPLELLTLSACETAVGDEMAALGLAGVAVKSGARSVLASLWQVSDKATKELMAEFYRQYFQNSRLTKAQALQIAQKKLIATNEFSHPSQWAPFLIIGNWL